MPLGRVARVDCYPWLVVGTVCIGAFMGQVDAGIAQLVLPELEREFHASIGAFAWVSIAYLLIVAAMLPCLVASLTCSAVSSCIAVDSWCSLRARGWAVWHGALDTLVGAHVLQALRGAGLLSANSVAILVGATGRGCGV